MMKLSLLLLLLTISLFSQTYQYESFKSFSYKGTGKIQILQGSENHLEIIGDHPKVSYHQSALDIEGFDCEVVLTVKKLQEAYLSGKIHLDIDELKGDHFTVVLNLEEGSSVEGTLAYNHLTTSMIGKGHVSFQGAVQEQTLFIIGEGTFSGEKLRAMRTDVNIQGSGTARVWTTAELKTSIIDDGSIFYLGSPKIIQGHGKNHGMIAGIES